MYSKGRLRYQLLAYYELSEYAKAQSISMEPVIVS